MTELFSTSYENLIQKGLVNHISPQGNDHWSGRSVEPNKDGGPFATVAPAQQASQVHPPRKEPHDES